MRKKLITALLCALLSSAAILCIADHQKMANNQPVLFSTWGRKYAPPLESHGAIMCSAKKLHSTQDGTFLEIIIDDDKSTVKMLSVKDKALLKKLSETDLEKIIGINFKASLPESILHASVNNCAAEFLVKYDEYDKYFEITDVSLS